MSEQLTSDQGCNDNPASGQIEWLEFKVSSFALRTAQEYGVIGLGTSDAGDVYDLAPLKLWSSERQGNKRLLGLSWMNDRFVLSHFVGAVWLDEGKESIPLIVGSKLSDDLFSVDPVAMYIEAGNVIQSSSEVFGCEPNQNIIEGKELPRLTLLQVAVFLKELMEFVRRHLRHGFIRVRNNLVGKVKGKIVVSENLRCNTVKGRDDRIFCQYHVIDIDTIPNQILRAALTLCIKYLGSIKVDKSIEQLQEWARICNNALASVTDRRISSADFQAVNYAGLMGRYKPIHRLAKMILRRLHTDGTGAFDLRNAVTVPFWLDMNALFEKYIEAKLAKEGVQYSAQLPISVNNGSFRFQCKPDFVIGDGFAVLDAKYKAILETRTDEDVVERGIENIKPNDVGNENALSNVITRTIHSDYYQIIAYSLLVSQWKNSYPASIACLIVPMLSHHLDNNEILSDGLKIFSTENSNPIEEFKLWVKNQQKCPFFELPLTVGENRESRETQTLFVVVLPCQLPTFVVDQGLQASLNKDA